MSCLCCCWRRKPNEAKQDENGNLPGDNELVYRVPAEEIEKPRASSMHDDYSIGSRSSVHRQPEIQVIVDSYHDPAVSPAVPLVVAATMVKRGPGTTTKDCANNQPHNVAEDKCANASSAETNITNNSIDESKAHKAAKEPYSKPKKHKAITGQDRKRTMVQKRSKSADDADNQFDREIEETGAEISIGSEVGSTHYFQEDIGLYSADPNAIAALRKELNDSFDNEFKENAAGRSQYKSDYVLYGSQESVSKVKDLMLIGMCKQREELLDCMSEIVPKVLQRINSERNKHNINDLRLQSELSEFASVLWQDRAKVRDGFVVVPRGVFFPRSGAPNRRYGCLVYYTTRAAHPQTIPDAMVNFWYNEGEPSHNTQQVFIRNLPGALPGASLVKVTDFPEANSEDCYVKQSTRMGRAFEKYRKDFRSQLLAAQCKAMGLHIDMLRTENNRNLICVAAIFDYVANPNGREMQPPFA